MNKIDFREGDKVFSFAYGNGTVITTTKLYADYSVAVDFESIEGIRSYTAEGKEINDDTYRSLFHGHNLRVAGEKLPTRTKTVWVNLYYSKGFGVETLKDYFKDEVTAVDTIRQLSKREYLKTISVEIPE